MRIEFALHATQRDAVGAGVVETLPAGRADPSDRPPRVLPGGVA